MRLRAQIAANRALFKKNPNRLLTNLSFPAGVKRLYELHWPMMTGGKDKLLSAHPILRTAMFTFVKLFKPKSRNFTI